MTTATTATTTTTFRQKDTFVDFECISVRSQAHFFFHFESVKCSRLLTTVVSLSPKAIIMLSQHSFEKVLMQNSIHDFTVTPNHIYIHSQRWRWTRSCVYCNRISLLYRPRVCYFYFYSWKSFGYQRAVAFTIHTNSLRANEMQEKNKTKSAKERIIYANNRRTSTFELCKSWTTFARIIIKGEHSQVEHIVSRLTPVSLQAFELTELLRTEWFVPMSMSMVIQHQFLSICLLRRSCISRRLASFLLNFNNICTAWLPRLLNQSD